MHELKHEQKKMHELKKKYMTAIQYYKNSNLNNSKIVFCIIVMIVFDIIVLIVMKRIAW